MSVINDFNINIQQPNESTELLSRTNSLDSTNNNTKVSLQSLMNLYNEYITKSNLLVLFSVLMLMIATATERVTFKIMVDQMLPFKFVLVQIIFLFSSIVFASISYYKSSIRNDNITMNTSHFPHSNIIKIAIIDTIPFILMAFSASGVPPTMTVILMHSSTIFVVIGSKITFPHRKYTMFNFIGIIFISIAIIICLLKAMFEKFDISSKSNKSITLETWIYLIGASLHGFTTLYKEKCIIEWSIPIDNFQLSSRLFFYQFIVAILMSMMFYLYLALTGYGTFDQMFVNVYYGWCSFLGYHDDFVDDQGFGDYGSCMGVIISYVISNAVVVICMNSVLELSNQILGRSTEAAIFAAFIVLWYYDADINGNGLFDCNGGLIDILAIILLLIGMEVYDKDPEPDVEIITNRIHIK